MARAQHPDPGGRGPVRFVCGRVRSKIRVDRQLIRAAGNCRSSVYEGRAVFYANK